MRDQETPSTSVYFSFGLGYVAHFRTPFSGFARWFVGVALRLSYEKLKSRISTGSMVNNSKFTSPILIGISYFDFEENVHFGQLSA
jgi:hypothetical protein